MTFVNVLDEHRKILYKADRSLRRLGWALGIELALGMPYLAANLAGTNLAAAQVFLDSLSRFEKDDPLSSEA